jgi:hypothetical protein
MRLAGTPPQIDTDVDVQRDVAPLPVVILAALALTAVAIAGCGQPCCNVDAEPVPLVTGPGGELMVTVATETGPGLALLDPGSPVTLWNRSGTPEVTQRDLRLLGPAPAGGAAPLRALFRDAKVVETPLGAIGDETAMVIPAAIIGADLLGNFAVEFGFGSKELIFRRRQSGSDDFLNRSGYAVLRLPRRGGGKIEVQTPRDWLGRRFPLEVAAARLLMRACAVAPVFDRDDQLPQPCCKRDVFRLGRGANLSLLLSTGTGPLVLGQTAWERLVTDTELQANPPVLVDRPLRVAQAPAPIPARWASIPRLALVNRQATVESDPGPCAELARARRTEQVALAQTRNSQHAICAPVCDREGGGTTAQTSAAYHEIDMPIEVAIIADTTPFLQGLRAEVRPQAPEVDGLIGAQALARSHLEIDYFDPDPRAIFSCEPYAPGTEVSGGVISSPGCRAVGRCPPDGNTASPCFGLPSHGQPKTCDNLDSVSACKD